MAAFVPCLSNFSIRSQKGLKYLAVGPTYREHILFELLAVLAILLGVSCQVIQTDADQFTTESPVTTAEPAGSNQNMLVFPTESATATQLPPSPTASLSELAVISNLPEAAIAINGVQVGRTPYQVALPAGTYSVTASLPALQPWQQEIHLAGGEPLTLTTEFAFSPRVEQILDVCVSEFWWAEDGEAVFYVECKPGPTESSPPRREAGPVWRLEPATGEITQDDDAWPPDWVPRAYQSIVPNTIVSSLISVSPSGQRVVFLEEVVDPSIPTPTIPTDPHELGPTLFEPSYAVHVVLDTETVVELGAIVGFPDRFSWSEDESLVFIPAYTQVAREQDGWLLDLKSMSLTPLAPPEHEDVEGTAFYNASLLPSGQAILYVPDVTTSSYYLWDFETGENSEMGGKMSYYSWLEGSRYLVYSNRAGLFWYDMVTDVIELVIDRQTVPKLYLWSLSPQGDRIVFIQESRDGSRRPGLWLMEFDTE